MTAQLTADLPDLSTWLFYAFNVALVVAYVVAIALLLRPSGVFGRGQLSPTGTAMAALFLLSCSVIHIELAVNAYQRASVVYGGTGVDVHLTLVVLAKLLVVIIALVFARRYGTAQPAPPVRALPLEIDEAHIRLARIDEEVIGRTTTTVAATAGQPAAVAAAAALATTTGTVPRSTGRVT